MASGVQLHHCGHSQYPPVPAQLSGKLRAVRGISPFPSPRCRGPCRARHGANRLAAHGGCRIKSLVSAHQDSGMDVVPASRMCHVSLTDRAKVAQVTVLGPDRNSLRQCALLWTAPSVGNPPTAADFRTIKDGPPSTRCGRSCAREAWELPWWADLRILRERRQKCERRQLLGQPPFSFS
jgi:hypothetical protein